MSSEILTRIAAEEHRRIEAIQLGDDERDALAVVKMFLSRIEADKRKGMKCDLDT